MSADETMRWCQSGHTRGITQLLSKLGYMLEITSGDTLRSVYALGYRGAGVRCLERGGRQVKGIKGIDNVTHYLTDDTSGASRGRG